MKDLHRGVAHEDYTLQYGWYQIPISDSQKVLIKQISGALTNKVFKISYETTKPNRDFRVVTPLLLRIYGDNVNDMIDRDDEIATLKRLKEYSIGPKLLGTFTNGRFEKWLNLQPLNPELLRVPEINAITAKNLNYFHNGVALTDMERYSLPTVWKQWFSWLPHARKAAQTMAQRSRGKNTLILNNFERFVLSVENYRRWLEEQYPSEHLANLMRFCHNDSQYGNILYSEKTKKMMVIDFEYSGPNPWIYDIANHFCLWMNDYNDPLFSHLSMLDMYPSADQRRCFYYYYLNTNDFIDSSTIPVISAFDTIEKDLKAWRPSSHAVWTLWGIIMTSSDANSDDFDYLGYAEDRAQMLAADLLQLGLVSFLDKSMSKHIPD